MLDPFDSQDISEKEMAEIFNETLNRCNKEIDVLVKAIDDIGDTIASIKDKMSHIEHKALKNTIIALVIEKLDFYVDKLD